jgi:DNA-binding FadR family transcriptional regulator
MTDGDELFHPIAGRRTFEDAVGQIAYAIHVGDLRVGDRLPSERQLAAQMEISRPTLREAMAVLTQAGIVSVTVGSRGGAVVRTDAVPAGLLTRGISIRTHEVAHVLEARRLFEPQVARLAASYATEDDFARLWHTVDEQRSSSDRDLAGKWDERFHIAMARATHNTTIVSVMRGILRQLAIAWDLDRELEFGVNMHVRTIHALASNDVAVIDSVMDDHLSILERQWEQARRPQLRRTADAQP